MHSTLHKMCKMNAQLEYPVFIPMPHLRNNLFELPEIWDLLLLVVGGGLRIENRRTKLVLARRKVNWGVGIVQSV
jgi:hypothetical protein